MLWRIAPEVKTPQGGKDCCTPSNAYLVEAEDEAGAEALALSFGYIRQGDVYTVKLHSTKGEGNA